MKITRNVILDLLPLYVDDEVSADTRALVESFIENDPEIASIAKRLKFNELNEDMHIPLKKENEMEAYKKTRWVLVLYIIGASLLFVIVGAALLAAFFVPV
jgi:hypothetical protein